MYPFVRKVSDTCSKCGCLNNPSVRSAIASTFINFVLLLLFVPHMAHFWSQNLFFSYPVLKTSLLFLRSDTEYHHSNLPAWYSLLSLRDLCGRTVVLKIRISWTLPLLCRPSSPEFVGIRQVGCVLEGRSNTTPFIFEWLVLI